MTTVYGDPVYREVEERGRSRLVLMRRVTTIDHRPAHDSVRAYVDRVTDEATDITVEVAHVPAVTTGRSWWERV